MKFHDVLKHPKSKEHAEQKGGIAVLSYHSGTEHGTGEIADSIHENSQASLYSLDTPNRVPSTRITPTKSDKLTGIKDCAQTAISIHGHDMKGGYERGNQTIEKEKTIYVTGGNQGLAKEVATELKQNIGEQYHIETKEEYTPKLLRGVSEYNIINKFEQKGVQIELPSDLRKSEEHRKIVADSVATVVDNESAKYESKTVSFIEAKDRQKEVYKKAA